MPKNQNVPHAAPPVVLPEIEPEIAPETVPEVAESVALEAAAPPDLPAIDGESAIEAAEQLLREAAPHDFEIAIIGGGPGGYTAALHAAQLGASVALIEQEHIGGVCLNRGCIPAKSLLESIGVLRTLRRARSYGIQTGEISPDFGAMHDRKNGIVADLRENVVRLLKENGVEIIRGHARFIEEHSLEIENPGQTRRVTAVNVIIATGGRPAPLRIEGADLPHVLTSDDVVEQRFVPKSLAVAGAGAVGIEFASLFAELGASVTILERTNSVLPGEDEDIQKVMAKALERDGVKVILSSEISRIEQSGSKLRIFYGENSLECDQLLMAAGRQPNVENLGLEVAGVELESGHIKADENGQTSVHGVYAIGDCIRRVGWAHQAAIEGRLAVEHILGKAPSGDTRFVPSCYYTHPEVASVGLTLKMAQKKGLEARTGTFYFRANGRAAVAGQHEGFVKIVVENGSEKLLGCQIIGPRATDLINEAALSLRNGQTLEELVGTIHAHPTFSEALPEAALAARR